MIDYTRLASDRDYFNQEIENIRTLSDNRVLSNELKMLSLNLYEKKIDPVDAKIVLSAIKNRQAILSGKVRAMRENSGSTDGGRTMYLAPKSGSTSVSNRVGTVSTILLVGSVVTTLVMYALLAFAHFIK